MPTNYPTKEQIITAPAHRLIDDGLYDKFAEWKKNVWNKRNELQTPIYQLLTMLSQHFKTPICIVFEPDSKGSSNFNILTGTISITGKPSINTALHEFAHALGEDEFGACVFSYQLFSAVFPRAYAKLEWRGHMLYKP